MEIRSITNTPEHEETQEGVKIWILISEEETGAKEVFLEISEMAPGASVGLHRHPEHEQVHFVLRGGGVRLLEGPIGEPVRQVKGEAALIRAGEWHGFENDTDEPCVLLSMFGGVGTYKAVPKEVQT
jgi:quercetin dioxygenase-like cupin family protein